MSPSELVAEIRSHDFDYYLDELMDNVSDDVDKREGSIIYDALAPAATVLAEEAITLANTIEFIYTQTSTGEFLDYRAVERGTSRIAATKTQVKATAIDRNNLPVTNIQIGDRFASIGDEPIFYTVIKVTDDIKTQLSSSQAIADKGGATFSAMATDVTAPVIILEAEELGTRPNGYKGQILPVSYNDALSYAEITEITVPARDSESDDDLRTRLLSPDTYNAYGGNVADYVDMLDRIEEVGAGQIYPAWQGGGTVKLVIVDNNFLPASDELIASVQNEIDPTPSGSGYGLAPIDHVVTVTAPTELKIDITSTITFATDIDETTVKNNINQALQSYFGNLRKGWAVIDATIGRGYNVTVYRSQILAEILKINGVTNATLPALNDQESDLKLQATNETSELPVLGTVTLND